MAPFDDVRGETESRIEAFLTEVDAYDALVDMYESALGDRADEPANETDIERVVDRVVTAEASIRECKQDLDNYLTDLALIEGIRTLPDAVSAQEAYEQVNDTIVAGPDASLKAVSTEIEKTARNSRDMTLSYEFVPVDSLETYLYVRQKEGRPQPTTGTVMTWDDEHVREELSDRLEADFGPDYDTDDSDVAARARELYNELVGEKSYKDVKQPNESDVIIEMVNASEPYLRDAVETYERTRARIVDHEPRLAAVIGETVAAKRDDAGVPEEPLFEAMPDYLTVRDVARVAVNEDEN